MQWTLDEVRYAQSADGERFLAALLGEDLGEANALRLMTRLRRDHTASQAGAALETARLRLKARDKFGDDAARMLFTREALEQASDPLIRKHLRLAASPQKRMMDACCSIGSDALAMARNGANVLGLDTDPVRVAMAVHNAQIVGSDARFEVADVTTDPRVLDADFVFFDPGRRDHSGRRIYDPNQYQPPLSTMFAWASAPRESDKQWQAKIAPGIDVAQIDALTAPLDDYCLREVWFVSVDGALKEALLTLSSRSASHRLNVPLERGAFRVSVDRLHPWPPNAGAPPDWVTPITEPRAWLIEPDPALIRAGKIADYAFSIGAAQLDSTIAYLTADGLASDPWLRDWARAWHILDWMPFNLKRLREVLRAANVGRVTVKKRGSPITPEALTAGLRLKGDRGIGRTLVLTRLRGEPIVIICEEQPGDRTSDDDADNQA